jgi:hypothetical protein
VEVEVRRRAPIFGDPSDLYEAGPDALIHYNGSTRQGYLEEYSEQFPTSSTTQSERNLRLRDEDNNIWDIRHEAYLDFGGNQNQQYYGRVIVTPARRTRYPMYSPTSAVNWTEEIHEYPTTSATTTGGYEVTWGPHSTSTIISGSTTGVIRYTTADNLQIVGETIDLSERRSVPDAWQFLAPPRVSDEERARWAARELQYREAERQRAEERRAAEGRAENLLLAILTPEQQDDYKSRRCFYMEVNGQHFRVDFGTTNNVKRIDPVTKRVLEGLCIHPSSRHGCPTPDVLVAQAHVMAVLRRTFSWLRNSCLRLSPKDSCRSLTTTSTDKHPMSKPEAATTTDDVWAAWISAAQEPESEQPSTINAWARWVAAENEQREREARAAREREARIAEQAEREKARREREKKEREEREAIKKRARDLLLSVLTPEQQDDYKKNRCFYVEANGEMFRINEGHAGNVEKVDPTTKRRIESYCIHPNMYQGGSGRRMPDEDAMAAQKLALETDPKKFKKTANVYH